MIELYANDKEATREYKRLWKKKGISISEV